MSKKEPQTKSQTNTASAKDLIVQIDKTLVELGKLTGYGPDYTDAKAKWAEIKAKFKAKAAAINKKALPREAVLGLVHGGGTKRKPTKATGKVPPKADPLKKPLTRQPEPPKLDLPKTPLPKSVVITPHSLECYLGSFAVEALAKRDASEFLSNDKVFWYRRALFPDPTAAKVQPKVMSVRVVERKGAQFTRSPYTVWVDIHIDGDEAKCKAWAEGVVNKNRGDQE